MSLSEYKARRHKEDPDWIDPEDYKTEEEYSAAMDRKWPRLAEPDEEGIDLNPADPRRRFIAIADGTTFRKADPLTEEDLAELEAMKAALFGSPEKKRSNPGGRVKQCKEFAT